MCVIQTPPCGELIKKLKGKRFVCFTYKSKVLYSYNNTMELIVIDNGPISEMFAKIMFTYKKDLRS